MKKELLTQFKEAFPESPMTGLLEKPARLSEPEARATPKVEAEALVFEEIYCCGVLTGYYDQHGREYDIDKNLIEYEEDGE